MKLTLIPESKLEFADGARHIDPRFGVLSYGPLDTGVSSETRYIDIGIIGTEETILALRSWLERCRDPIAGKESRLRNLFPPFPGFAGDTMFQAELVFDDRLDRVLNIRELRGCVRDSSDGTRRAVCELVLAELAVLLETGRPDVVLIAMPLEILERVEPAATSEREPSGHQRAKQPPVDFHDLLKARAMALRTPLQLLNPQTYDPSVKRTQKRSGERRRTLQDEATRAWNLHTALYYKSGGYPWRLAREERDLATCYLGVSFFRTIDGESVWTSVAQVFNQRGAGMIVRGGPAHQSKLDRQTHLSGADAQALVQGAMGRYRSEHGHLPARLVIHKSSRFSPDETTGFRAGIEDLGIASCDLVSLRRAHTKLFRFGSYPPQRGTLWSLERERHILYTRGSVPFYGTYPGMYVPRPIEFRVADPERTPAALAGEMLALTKMNWNNTQFDQRDPITLRAADEVGDILRYVPEAGYVDASYSAYM
jgi:hypothetical protein